MSESETEEVVVEEVEGVTITKYFDEEEFHFPSMVLEFDSHRNEEVEIRVEEAKPAGISIENIGFHPAHGADYWSIEEDTLVFEYPLAANTEYRTVYALRTKGPDEARGMFAEPNVVEITPPLPETGEVEAAGITRSASDSPYAEGGSDAADVAAEIPDEPEVGEPATDEPAVDGPEMELDLEEPESQEPESEEAASQESDSEAAPSQEPESEAADESEAETVVEQLARELREDAAPDESLAVVEAQFGTATDSSGSLDARLTQVQEDVANLRSYTNALEEFLDEEGTAQEIMDEFESRLEGFEGDVDRVEGSVDSLTGELQALREDVNDFQGSLDSLSANYADLTDEVDSLREDIAETDDQLPAYDIDEQFSEIDEELSELDEFVSGLRSAFD